MPAPSQWEEMFGDASPFRGDGFDKFRASQPASMSREKLVKEWAKRCAQDRGVQAGVRIVKREVLEIIQQAVADEEATLAEGEDASIKAWTVSVLERLRVKIERIEVQRKRV